MAEAKTMIVLLFRSYLLRVMYAPPIPMRMLCLLAAILLYGTTGFLYFELPENPDLNWSDALWYSVVTMTTVGYGDFFPKTLAGRMLVGVPLMFLGIGLLGYTLSVIAAALITAKDKELKGMSAFELNGHLVILNFPGLAKIERVLAELRNDASFGRETKVVLIDEELTELPPELVGQGVHFVRGNPTRDATLVRASIDRARHAVVLNKRPGDPYADTLNVTIALAIEARNHKINSVVECFDPATEELLRKAGCDRIVCTSRFDAHFVSQELLNPGVQEVMDELLSSVQGQQLYVTPIQQPETRKFPDVAGRCRAQGHLAIGIRRGTAPILNADPDLVLQPDDLVITIGPSRPKSF
jgi:voltage-gated potassium channel